MIESKSQILIVDDTMTMRKLVRKLLLDLGYKNIIDAADGVDAWQELKNPDHQIKLVITDWNMPRCSGIELLKKIRAEDKIKNMPVIMLTAETEDHQIELAKKIGVQGYLKKPFSKETLLNTLLKIE